MFDCAGVADGSAAADRRAGPRTRTATPTSPLYIKALSFVAGNGSGLIDPDYDYTTFPEIVACGRGRLRQAGVTDPRAELAMAEVHDCFTPTELVLMEDLGFCERGHGLEGGARRGVRPRRRPAGQPRRRPEELRSPGRRVRPADDVRGWLQLRGEAPEERRISTYGKRALALTHNLGGYPGEMVSFVSILGTSV